jgi:hypothetical protein
MNKFMDDMKHTTRTVKQHLGFNLTEGKQPLPIEVYKKLAEKLFLRAEKENVFCHRFFVLDWCLMKVLEQK